MTNRQINIAFIVLNAIFGVMNLLQGSFVFATLSFACVALLTYVTFFN